MQARHRVSLFLLVLSPGLANAAWAAPEYRVTIVCPVNSEGINNHGHVVGSSNWRPPLSTTMKRPRRKRKRTGNRRHRPCGKQRRQLG